ncbi:MAG: TatD family hydrolase [Bacteroidota bacterium]
MLIDTHTHLYSHKFDADREAMLERAKEAGVDMALLPAIDSQTHVDMIKLEEEHPNFCRAMMGLHPVSVGEDYKKELNIVKQYLDQRVWVALGEIGLDFYWDKTYVKEQEEAFIIQCQWALEYELPIVIHARDSIPRLLELLEGMKDSERPQGVFHCWTGNLEQANMAIDMGFYLGIGGILTFKNGGIDKVIPALPKDKILLETDSPYLAPTPYRGKRNETAYVKEVAIKLAEIWGTSLLEVGRITTENAINLFQLDPATDHIQSA